MLFKKLLEKQNVLNLLNPDIKKAKNYYTHLNNKISDKEFNKIVHEELLYSGSAF